MQSSALPMTWEVSRRFSGRIKRALAELKQVLDINLFVFSVDGMQD
jgi:hypothetical protein